MSRVIRRGTPEWEAAVAAVLARDIAAGRLPPKPPDHVLDRIAALLVLKERERELRRKIALRKLEG